MLLCGQNIAMLKWFIGDKSSYMSPVTILYIEDNQENRILIRRILTFEGYQVLEAGNAKEGLELLATSRPDLILMDINIPDIDGYSLTSKIRTLSGFSDVPIIALTANVMRGDRERSLEAGCNGYIQKPVDIDLLPQQIERFIRK
jgi:two-component system cell cycle response regulator DivK